MPRLPSEKSERGSQENVPVKPTEEKLTALPPSAAVKPPRLMSIDALRGFDMLWIVGGAGVVTALEQLCLGHPGFFSKQLQHVAWDGMRFEDLIMPLFMFLAGVSLPFAISARLAKNPSPWRLWGHVLKRIVLLWIFGMAVQGDLLSWVPENWKYYSNTLQAIAAGYLIAFVFSYYFTLRWQVVFTLGLLMASWGIFAWIPAPGGVAGDYTPNGNIGIWLDRLILGSHQDGTTYTWIIGSLNFGVTTMQGVFAGRLLRNPLLSGHRKTSLLLAGGILSIALAYAWAPIHPIIKHLWTGSFVLLSGGICFALLAMFYWIIDVCGWKRWSYFFTVIGANAITAYMMAHIWPMRALSKPLVGGLSHWISQPGYMALVMAIADLAVLWLILWVLYRNKIFLKV